MHPACVDEEGVIHSSLRRQMTMTASQWRPRRRLRSTGQCAALAAQERGGHPASEEKGGGPARRFGGCHGPAR